MGTYVKVVSELEFLITKIASRYNIGAELLSWKRLDDIKIYHIRYEAVPHVEFRTLVISKNPAKILSLRETTEKVFEITLKLYPRVLIQESSFKIYESAIRQRVEELHALGIVHNDLHEENIVIDYDGTVKLIDFGMSKFQTDTSDDLMEMDILFK